MPQFDLNYKLLYKYLNQAVLIIILNDSNN